MQETIVDKIKKLLNIKNKKCVILNKKIGNREWYLGLVSGKYIMTKELDKAVIFKQSKSDLSNWLDWTNRRFSKGWSFKIVESK